MNRITKELWKGNLNHNLHCLEFGTKKDGTKFFHQKGVLASEKKALAKAAKLVAEAQAKVNELSAKAALHSIHQVAMSDFIGIEGKIAAFGLMASFVDDIKSFNGRIWAIYRINQLHKAIIESPEYSLLPLEMTMEFDNIMQAIA